MYVCDYLFHGSVFAELTAESLTVQAPVLKPLTDEVPCIGECCQRSLEFESNLHTNQRFSNRASRFLDGHQRGLNGKQATWANKRYRGHRTLPDILKELNDKGIA
ncbi:hypothetical protein M405DRAFT_738539 [Rhizopogon salebrosus TDB-379]|nr:hypothetical protein M405DRAFT_738539 [Rhizopogon salebrosus TDB-379]